MRAVMRRLAGRRPRTRKSAVNAAQRVPDEILLHIFEYVLGGVTSNLWHDGRSIDGYSIDGIAALVHLCTVCRSWRGCATQILYSRPVLTRSSCLQLIRTLRRTPALAKHVKHISFPEHYDADSPPMPTRSWKWSCPRSRPSSSLKAAVEDLLRRCPASVSNVVVNSSAGWMLASLGRLEHLTSLACQVPWKRFVSGIDGVFVLPIQCLPGRTVENLTNLTISTFHVKGIAPSCIRLTSLHLRFCWVDYDFLLDFFSAASCLRDLELAFVQLYLPGDRAQHRVFDPCVYLPSLRRLCLKRQKRPPISLTRLTFDAIPLFRDISTLVITRNLLPALDPFPPALNTLVVLDPDRAWWKGRPYGDSLSFAAEVKNAVSRCSYSSPRLQRIVMCPDISGRHLADLCLWPIASFLLREFLAPLSIQLVVNVLLHSEQ